MSTFRRIVCRMLGQSTLTLLLVCGVPCAVAVADGPQMRLLMPEPALPHSLSGQRAAVADGPQMRLLMPDDFSDLHVVAWRVEPAVPDPHNPLLEGETPWDRGGVMTHGTVLKDPLDGLFKASIVCTPPHEELKDLSTRNHQRQKAAYRLDNLRSIARKP